MSTVLKDPAHGRRLVYGVAINDANYQVYAEETVDGRRKRVWACPYYQTWKRMLRRCLDEKTKALKPAYAECCVDSRWHSLMAFRAWMEEQDWRGNELDKDLLVRGNKIYSPETCLFIPRAVNLFITESGAIRGKWPIGVSYHRRDKTFRAECSDLHGKRLYLGNFQDPDDAHLAWLAKKRQLAALLAAQQSDPRISEALISRYANYQSEK